MDAFAKDERRSDCTNDGRLTLEPELLTETVDGFDSGAVSTDQVRDLELLEFVAGPRELLIACREEMEAADERVDGGLWKFLAGESERVDDAGVPAPGDQHKTLRRVENERLIFGNCVFDQTSGRLYFAGHGPVALRIRARDGAGEPCARKKFDRLIVLDDLAARGFVFFTNGDHRVAFALGVGSAVEDAFADMDDRQRVRILLHKLAAQREEAADVVVVIVREDDFADVADIEFEITQVGKNGLGTGTGIDENAMAIGFHQRGEAPFADALISEHGGQNGDLQVLNLRVRFRGRSLRGDDDCSCEDAARQEKQAGDEFASARIAGFQRKMEQARAPASRWFVEHG